MTEFENKVSNYNFEDYSKWKGRWDLIDGIPYAKVPMPSPKHQHLAGELHISLSNAIKEAQCKKCKVYQPIDLKINENTILNPDLLIVCKEIKKHFLDFPPNLVVEILSKSTETKDRISKFQIYQSFGIKYYIIVDPKTEKMEIYQLQPDGKYKLQDENTELVLMENCKINPDFKSIWD